MSAYWNQSDVGSRMKESINLTSFSMPLTETVIVCVVVTIISLATTVGNLLVLVAVHMDKKLRTVSNMFIVSLAVSDMLVGMFAMPIYTISIVKEKWLFGSLFCDLWLSFDYFVCTASNGNILAICCDRYLSITQPLVYRIKRTPKLIKRTILLVWTIAIFLVPPWIFAWPYIEGQRTVPETECYIQYQISNVAITVIITITVNSLPIVVMLVLCLKIYRETEKRKHYMMTIDSKGGGRTSIDRKLGRENPKISDCSQNLASASASIKCKSMKNVDSEHDDKCPGVINDTFMPFNDSKQDSHSAKLQSANKQEPTKIETARPQTRDNRKAAKMLTIILAALFVAYFPYTVFVIINSICTACIPMGLYELGKYSLI